MPILNRGIRGPQGEIAGTRENNYGAHIPNPTLRIPSAHRTGYWGGATHAPVSCNVHTWRFRVSTAPSPSYPLSAASMSRQRPLQSGAGDPRCLDLFLPVQNHTLSTS